MSISLLDQWRLAQAIIADPNIGAPAARVGVALLGFQNRVSGRCDPALETVGKAAGMKRTATWQAVSVLEKAGWIVSEGAGGRAKGNAYTFAFDRLKPFENANGIETETVRESEPYQRVNGSGFGSKPFGKSNPNPKEEPSLAKAKEMGGAGAPHPGRGGAVAPRGARVSPVSAMLAAGGLLPEGRT